MRQIYILLLLTLSSVKGVRQSEDKPGNIKDLQDAVIRINSEEKNTSLTFTAGSRFEGGEHILKVLEKYDIKCYKFKSLTT